MAIWLVCFLTIAITPVTASEAMMASVSEEEQSNLNARRYLLSYNIEHQDYIYEVFGEDLGAKMICIVYGESTWKQNAKSPNGKWWGYFQIAVNLHPDIDRQRLLTDHKFATDLAFEIYQSQGLRAWSAYEKKKYWQAWEMLEPLRNEQ